MLSMRPHATQLRQKKKKTKAVKKPAMQGKGRNVRGHKDEDKDAGCVCVGWGGERAKE